MYTTTLALLATLAPFAVAQITSTYTSYELTATGTPTYTAPVESQTDFPKCTVECITNAGALGLCPDPLAPNCVCQGPYRGAVAACLSLTCTDAEWLRSFELGVQVCDPIYKADSSLLPEVSSAIASATKSASDTLATRDPKQLKDYPPCAIRCMPDAFSASGCENFSNLDCVCHCPIFGSTLGACQLQDCKGEDVRILVTIVESLCAPVGGTAPTLPGAYGNKNGTCPTGTGVSGPTAAARMMRRGSILSLSGGKA